MLLGPALRIAWRLLLLSPASRSHQQTERLPGQLTLYPLSLIMRLVRGPNERSSSEETPDADDNDLPKPKESGAEVEKPEFLRIRDQLIAEGEGPADIVFGPDLFDPRIREDYAPYMEALWAGRTNLPVEKARLSTAEAFGTTDESALLDILIEHASSVREPAEQPVKSPNELDLNSPPPPPTHPAPTGNPPESTGRQCRPPVS